MTTIISDFSKPTGYMVEWREARYSKSEGKYLLDKKLISYIGLAGSGYHDILFPEFAHFCFLDDDFFEETDSHPFVFKTIEEAKNCFEKVVASTYSNVGQLSRPVFGPKWITETVWQKIVVIGGYRRHFMAKVVPVVVPY